MEDESIEDTYDWLDTDENYPLDSAHTFGWRPWVRPQGVISSDNDWLSPWCEEHNVCVRDQKTANVASSDEERREWIAEHRDRLVKKCLEQQARKKSFAALTQISQYVPPAPVSVQQIAEEIRAVKGTKIRL